MLAARSPSCSAAATARQRSATCAGVPVRARQSHARLSTVRASSNPFQEALNSLTVALKNSPLNQGKKALAKAQAGDYDAAATRAKIEALIMSNKVLVFSWSGCPFCKDSKRLLTEVGAQFTAIELDTIPEGKAIRAELAAMTDRTSVPNIWISGQNVGGYNDGPGVNGLHKQQKLVPLLKQAGALA